MYLETALSLHTEDGYRWMVNLFLKDWYQSFSVLEKETLGGKLKVKSEVEVYAEVFAQSRPVSVVLIPVM